MKYFSTLVVFIIGSAFMLGPADGTIRFCGKDYVTRKSAVFLKDEGIMTTGVQVLDKKTKKFLFGYFVQGKRNDTNFIYSRVFQSGDTIYLKNYHRFKISNGTDSTLAKFICTSKGIVFYSHQRYWNGEITRNEIFNSLVGQ